MLQSLIAQIILRLKWMRHPFSNLNACVLLVTCIADERRAFDETTLWLDQARRRPLLYLENSLLIGMIAIE